MYQAILNAVMSPGGTNAGAGSKRQVDERQVMTLSIPVV